MKIKFLTSVILLPLLCACSDVNPYPKDILKIEDINIICLQGVQYYKLDQQNGYAGYGLLAPVYDYKTKEIKLCYIQN